MNPTTAAGAELAPTGALTGEPQWLAIAPEPIYAVLHTPQPCSAGVHAALLLPAFGWDDECSYRRRRDWATRLASAGIVAARFDFPGRENSAGSPLTPLRAESWVSATAAAARWLRDSSGCERLTAIGIGIGGLIAYRAVYEEAPIDDLVLWGVRASGRAHVRELRAYAAITARADDADAAREDGAIGIGGHLMSAETADALSAIDLTELSLPGAARRRILLIGRDSHGIDQRLEDHLKASDADLTLLESDEYQALMSPPDIGLTPTRTLSASVEWIAADTQITVDPRRVDDTRLAAFTTPNGHSRTPAAPVTCTSFEHDGVEIRERLLTVETSAGRLRGVISEPTVPAGGLCMVSVNSGALRHTGPNRMFVEIGRRAAAHGVAAARVDLPGLGDSEGTAIRSFERTESDDRTSLAVMKEIYDHLERIGVADRFVAAGFSLGGYLTVRVATADRRVKGALSVNPTGFVWTDKQRKRVLKDLIALAGPDALMDDPAPSDLPLPLRELVDGVGRMQRGLDAKIRRTLARSQVLWRIEHRRELTGLSARLDELAAAETQMLLLLSANEQLLRMLELTKVAAKLRDCPGIRIERLPDEDHLLRPLWIQEIVAERFIAGLLEFSAASGAAVAETPDHLPG